MLKFTKFLGINGCKIFFTKLVKASYYETIFLFASLLGIFIPRNKSQWLFCVNDTYPFGCNLRSIYEKSLEDPSIKPIIFCPNSTIVREIMHIYRREKLNGEYIKIVSKKNPLNCWHYIRSKVCFVSNYRSDIYSRMFNHFGHHTINLWHGVPIKAIGFGELRSDNLNKNRKFLNRFYHGSDIIISNSEIDKMAISSCMSHNLHKVWITGLPRNDALVSSAGRLQEASSDQELRLKDAIKNMKFVLYAPTWRESELSRGLSSKKYSNSPFKSEDNFNKLINFIEREGILLGVRRHFISESWDHKKSKNIINCDQATFPETQILLRSADILITDYSGIWVDFLLLNRPILGFCYDYEEYIEGRPFLYNFKKVFPGKITYDFDSMLESLGSLLSNGDGESDRLLRQRSFDIFHKYNDSNNSQRVIDKVMELVK